MSLRNPLVVLVVFSALALLAACGSNSSSNMGPINPPPSGGFTNSNLNGTYVVSTNGVDDTGLALSILGVIVADGNGNITGGTIDIVGANFGVAAAQAVASGSTYNVTADGRGTATVKNPVGAISLDFVLTSTGSGLVTNLGGNGFGTGSGSLDLQSSQSQPTGSYAFTLAGVDNSLFPLATVGAFTLDSNGAISAGVQDFNDAGTPIPNQGLNGSVVIGSGTTPGIATLNSAVSGGFDFYVVDSSHFKFIETDGVQFLAGDAFTQSSIPSGTLVFTMAGLDLGGFPVAAGGVMTSDGVSISNGAEDLNDGGNGVSPTFSGSFTTLTNGRAVLNLSGFAPAIQFAVYPTSGGMLMVETDSLALMTGAAFVQTSTALAANQGFGLNLQAINLNNGPGTFFEEDDLAEFTSSSSGFTGVVDFNDGGSTTFQQSLGGTYTLAGSSGTATFTTGSATAFDLIFYPVDGSKFIAIEADTNQIGTGSFAMQSGTGAAQAMLLHLAAAHPKLPGHFNGQRKLRK